MPGNISIVSDRWCSQKEYHLLDARAVVSLETSVYAISRRLNVSQLLSICIFGVCAHTRYCQDLFILLHTLLELAKEHAQTYGYLSALLVRFAAQ
jgi:hypothetical protein